MNRSSADEAHPSRRLVAGLGVALVAAAFLFSCHMIFDPDTWWHLATGRWIVENGMVPAHDVFSFATSDAPWVSYSWLPATGMYLVFNAGGPAALILVKAAIVAGAVLLAYLLALRSRVHPWLVACALLVALPIARFQFRERPQILMFALVTLYFWLLASPGAERSRRVWVVLPLAQVAWANVHGSYFLGIALVGALLFEHLASAAVTAGRRRSAPDWRGLALAGGLLALVSLASLANAFGLELVLQTLRDMTSLSVTRSFVNEEFQALSPRIYPGFVALTAATLLSFIVAGRAARPFVGAAFAGLTLLAFGSVRFAAIAAFLDASILAWNLVGIPARIAKALNARAWLASTTRRHALLGAAATLFVATTFGATLQTGREERFGLGINESRFPGPAVQFLARSGFQGNLFNSWIHGGYALWHLPAVKDLVDGRALPAHLALLERLVSLDRQALERWLSAQDVRGALLARDDAWLEFFASSPSYVRAFFDDRAVVFLRTDVAPAGASAGIGYRFIKPETYDPSYLVPIARGPQAAEAEAEIRKSVGDSPGSFTPRFLLGFFLEAQGKGEALEHYLEAGRLNPGLAIAHYDLAKRAGAIALATGQAARVEPFLREAIRVKPGDPGLEALLGSSLYVQRKFADAEPLLRSALRRSPDQVVALTNLGYLLVDTGRAPEAVAHFERARSLARTDESAAYGLALALQASGDRRRAADAWREFLAKFPGSRWAPRARESLGALPAP